MKKKKSVIWTCLLVILALIVGAVLAVLFFINAKLDLIQYADEIDRSVYENEPPETSEAEIDYEEEDIVDISGLEQVETAPPIPESEVFTDSDVFNILVIGTDERTVEFNSFARSDCMIILSIDKKNNTVKLVSLERGIGVPVLEGKHEGEYDWLTHIFAYGGADLLLKTVEHCFKVDVDHYVRFNFTSVKRIIDTIGGIEIELTKEEVWGLNEHKDSIYVGQQTGLREGVNRLYGPAALIYARLRRIDSDWRRIERQRKVIMAVANELKGSSLLELNELANAALPLVQTNLSKLQIAELILYAPNFLEAEFDDMTIPKAGTYGGMNCMQGRGGFAVDYEINNDLLRRFLYEGATSEELLAE